MRQNRMRQNRQKLRPSYVSIRLQFQGNRNTGQITKQRAVSNAFLGANRCRLEICSNITCKRLSKWSLEVSLSDLSPPQGQKLGN